MFFQRRHPPAIPYGQLFQQLCSGLPFAAWLTNTEGQVLAANRQAEQLIGVTMNTHDSQPIALQSLLPSDAWAQFWPKSQTMPVEPHNYTGEFATAQGQQRLQLYWYRPSGFDQTVMVTAQPVAPPVPLVMTDDQLAQSQKMQAVGQLAGGIAHDFNNLLTAIIGFCDLLLLRHKAGDPSFGDIMQIKQNAARGANLVRQILAFSRQQTLQPKPLDLTEVVGELAHLMKRLLGEKVTLQLDYSREVGLVFADHTQLEQAIINLAVNARDAMPQGGTLQIKTSLLRNKAPQGIGPQTILPPGNWLAVSVGDSGTGISEENLKRIFEPFFTTKPLGQGTGLGLATVYGIVQQSGGHIGVESELGKGTTFTLYLPEYDQEKAAPEAAKPIPAAPAKLAGQDLTGAGTILLVEDEDAVRQFSSRALKLKGYDILEAPHGEAALKIMLESEKTPVIKLLITDVIMPGIDGPQLFLKLRETFPTLKVLFVSGYTEEKLNIPIDEANGIYFLPKPYSLADLSGKVKGIVG